MNEAGQLREGVYELCERQEVLLALKSVLITLLEGRALNTDGQSGIEHYAAYNDLKIQFLENGKIQCFLGDVKISSALVEEAVEYLSFPDQILFKKLCLREKEKQREGELEQLRLKIETEGYKAMEHAGLAAIILKRRGELPQFNGLAESSELEQTSQASPVPSLQESVHLAISLVNSFRPSRFKERLTGLLGRCLQGGADSKGGVFST